MDIKTLDKGKKNLLKIKKKANRIKKMVKKRVKKFVGFR